MRKSCRLLLLAAALLPASALAAPRVVADVLPVQAILARVMQGVAVPQALLPPGASPHAYALRPSDAAMLQDADLVFWVGEALSPWLAEPITALGGDAVVVQLAELPGVELLDFREGGAFEPHEHASETPEHDAHAVDHPGGIDPHLWLDPLNAAVIARGAADALAAADPANAAAYRANAAAFGAEIATLTADIEARLAPLRSRPFIVFHDAFQYFERRFGLAAAGAISLGDADMPSAARVAELRDRVRDGKIACIFTQPQFEPRLADTVIEGTDARTAELDDIGTGIAPGPGLYPLLMRNLADGFAECLAARAP